MFNHVMDGAANIDESWCLYNAKLGDLGVVPEPTAASW
jgi:hypothetical protein